MRTIALVDDDSTNIETLKRLLEQIALEEGEVFEYHAYPSGEALLFDYHSFDILFLDIEMNGINGLDTARAIREKDNQTIIIFQTKMAQYASEGYDVDAIGYLVKPVTYESLKIKIKKAIHILNTQKKDQMIMINVGGAKKMVSASSIFYLEADGHQIRFYTKEGVIDGWGSLREFTTILSPLNFVEISRYHIVNLQHMNKVEGDTVVVDNKSLAIGRTKKNNLLKKIASYFIGS